MEILVKLGKTKNSSEVKVSAPSADCSVAEVLTLVRRKLPYMYAAVLKASEEAGSVVYLALDANESERLNETKQLRDYLHTGDNCTLWLMCAPAEDVSECR